MSGWLLAFAAAINLASCAVLLWTRRERRRLEFLRYGREGRDYRRARGELLDLSTPAARRAFAARREPAFGGRPAGEERYGR